MIKLKKAQVKQLLDAVANTGRAIALRREYVAVAQSDRIDAIIYHGALLQGKQQELDAGVNAPAQIAADLLDVHPAVIRNLF